ncbi:MAG: hypothetical protein ACR2QG_10700 [Gammaproteobacteria bacterium]
MTRYLHQPIFWCWLMVLIWAIHVIGALILQSRDALVISLLALGGALMVVWVIDRRRRRNFYPNHHQS